MVYRTFQFDTVVSAILVLSYSGSGPAIRDCAACKSRVVTRIEKEGTHADKLSSTAIRSGENFNVH
jgi:hypothetical protein